MVVRMFVLFLVGLLGFSAAAEAQSEARIRVVIPSIHQVEEDLKWLIELSPTPELKKQWLKLKEEVLDAFTQGVDEAKPIEVDLVFRKDEMSHEYRVPVTILKQFIDSISGMGFKFKTLAADSFYQFAEKGKRPFFLRFDKNYTWISSFQAAVPANPPLATDDMKPLLNLKKDVVAELKNDAAGIALRRDNFKEFRKQIEALIKLHRNEDKNAFELRKLALTQQLEEAERFLVETESLLLSWTTQSSGPNPMGRGEISLTALPGTDLLKSIEQFAVKPSYFANVVLHSNPLFVGKLNFPLDSLRVRHLNEFFKTVRPTLETEINAQTATNDAQKAAMKQASNKFLDMLDAGAMLGVVDSFIDAHAVSPGKNVLVTGIRAADGKQADELVKLLPEIKSDWQVKLDAHEHAGVSIHELTMPKARLESFQRIFAGETVFLVGTSKDAVWGAAGVDALTHLKAAIDQVGQPAPEKASAVAVSYQIQMAKLITLLDIIQKEAPSPNGPKSKEQLQAQKDLEKYRKLAQDTMGNCESMMHGELKRIDNKIEGFIEFNECVLKYIGATIADGVKTTLQ